VHYKPSDKYEQNSSNDKTTNKRLLMQKFSLLSLSLSLSQSEHEDTSRGPGKTLGMTF
jgi:hypothetical protein